MAQLCGKGQRDITAYYTDRENEAEMQFPSRVHYTRDTYPWQSICVRFLTLGLGSCRVLTLCGWCKFGSRSRGLSCKFSADWYCMYLCYCIRTYKMVCKKISRSSISGSKKYVQTAFRTAWRNVGCSIEMIGLI